MILSANHLSVAACLHFLTLFSIKGSSSLSLTSNLYILLPPIARFFPSRKVATVPSYALFLYTVFICNFAKLNLAVHTNESARQAMAEHHKQYPIWTGQWMRRH